VKNKFYLETIKALDGEIYNIDYHQKRYEKVLAAFGVVKVKDLREYLTPPRKGLYRCRVLYTLNSIDVSYHKYIKRRINTLKLVYDDEIEYSVKSADRKKLDLLFSKKEFCDDVLIVKKEYVSDTTIANIAFLKNGVWFTPKNALLRGTTRERLLYEGKIVEKNILKKDLFTYERVALLNAMIDFDIIPVDNIRNIIC